jgi:hypothetical protein
MPELVIGSGDFQALAADILRSGSVLRFRARGISMDPSIVDGDVVEVRRVHSGQVRVGDVILARSAGQRLVVHRVVARTGDAHSPTLTTQGDALQHPDRPIGLDQVLGRATAVSGDAGRRRLDRGVGRCLGLLWVRCRPAAPRVHRLARVLWRLRPPVLDRKA